MRSGTMMRGDNRAGALKNLMYRLRNTLKKNLGEEDYILTGRGTYYWNPDIPIWLDCEEFDSWYTKERWHPVRNRWNVTKMQCRCIKAHFFPKCLWNTGQYRYRHTIIPII